MLDKTGRLIKVSELVKINRGLENDDADSVLSDSMSALARQVSNMSTAMLQSRRSGKPQAAKSARKERERMKAQRQIVLNNMRDIEKEYQ